jgi:hypothetical protein
MAAESSSDWKEMQRVMATHPVVSQLAKKVRSRPLRSSVIRSQRISLHAVRSTTRGRRSLLAAVRRKLRRAKQ